MDKYKDLPELITDMLIKQDQTTARLDQVVERVNQVAERVDQVVVGVNQVVEGVNQIVGRLNKTNDILTEFMGVSVKQWEEQAYFNRQIFEKVENVERLLTRLLNLDERVRHLEQMEQRLEEKTKSIGTIEDRLAKLENHLKAS